MNSDVEQRTEENDDPQEVVGPEGCNATLVSTNVEVEALLNDETDTSFPAGIEIQEQFVSQPIPVGIDPRDGMPRPLDDIVSLPIAPPFNHRSLVCMEDDRSFVELFANELTDEAKRASAPPGFVFTARDEFERDGTRAIRASFRPADVNGERFGMKTVEQQVCEGVSDTYTRVTFVRPFRVACQHYVRSVLCHDPSIPFGEIGHEIMYRNCTARRSVGGAFMSLNSEGVYACELRFPRDQASEQRHIVAPDQRRLTQNVENVSLFNLQAK